MRRANVVAWGVVAVLAVGVAACGSSTTPAPSTSAAPTLTLYTSVTQNTVDAVVAGFKKEHPGATVNVFRATTGQLNARLAADQRSGGVRADVIWGTDPLSMQNYADQKILKPWPLPDVQGVPTEFQAPYFWGTRILYMIIVAHRGVTPVPTSWSDLTNPAYRGKVALPDPAAAGSAFAALGYFAMTPAFGVGYYDRLKSNKAVQVATVPQVVTDVASGRYEVGITLDSEVRTAVANGSPVALIWPSDGAIALYSPIAETTTTHHPAAADDWLRYVLSAQGQQAIASTGWQPVLAGIAGPPQPPGATSVSPDWTKLFGQQQQLLRQYQGIFGA
jgi:iron(III) transport system substrate-binding protein